MKHSRAGAPASHPSDRPQPSYEEAVAAHGPALERLARSSEFDPDERQDLLQEIHLDLWRSLARFDRRCSVRTWVYRVAHNVAASHVTEARRRKSVALVGVEDVEDREIGIAPDASRGVLVSQLMELLRRLRPLNRELVILYMEGLDARELGDVVGMSAGNVATKPVASKGSWPATPAGRARMETDRAPDTAVAAWRAQPTAGFRMSAEQITARIRADQRAVRREFARGGGSWRSA